jgi:hypothetical protein
MNPTAKSAVYANDPHLCDVMTFAEMRTAYFRDIHYPTMLSRVFWSDANMNRLTGEVARVLSERAKARVLVQPDLVFYETCARLCGSTANVVDIAGSLLLLNQVVASELIYLLMSATRQRKLFLKWAITGDRDIFLPPPVLTHGRHRIVQPTSEVYQVQHNPNGRYNQEFQQALAGRCKYSQFTMFDKLLDKNTP